MIIIEETSKKFPNTQEIAGESLGSYTTAGWIVLAVLEVDGPIEYWEPVCEKDPLYNQAEWGPGGKKGIRRTMIGRITRYLVGRDEASAIAAIARERDVANNSCNDANMKAGNLLVEKVHLEAEKENAEMHAGKDRQRCQAAIDALEDMRAKYRKMEHDIAALRTFYGEKEFGEALASAKKSGGPYRS